MLRIYFLLKNWNNNRFDQVPTSEMFHIVINPFR